MYLFIGPLQNCSILPSVPEVWPSVLFDASGWPVEERPEQWRFLSAAERLPSDVARGDDPSTGHNALLKSSRAIP